MPPLFLLRKKNIPLPIHSTSLKMKLPSTCFPEWFSNYHSNAHQTPVLTVNSQLAVSHVCGLSRLKRNE